jgi:hypothetical protein
MRVGRRVEKQRMHLAGRPVVLEDADILDSRLAFTSIAYPPHVGFPGLLVIRTRKTFFQSSFMLMTIQPSFFASRSPH